VRDAIFFAKHIYIYNIIASLIRLSGK